MLNPRVTLFAEYGVEEANTHVAKPVYMLLRCQFICCCYRPVCIPLLDLSLYSAGLYHARPVYILLRGMSVSCYCACLYPVARPVFILLALAVCVLILSLSVTYS